MRLQSDKSKICRGLPAVDVSVYEIRLLLTVQKDRKLMILYADLKLVPLTWAVCDDTFVEGLATDVVDRARRPKSDRHSTGGGLHAERTIY